MKIESCPISCYVEGMQTSWLLGGVIVIAALIAGQRSPAPPASGADIGLANHEKAPQKLAGTPENTANTDADPSTSTVRGEVLETHVVTSYVYLRLRTETGEVWAAVPSATVTPHSTVEIVGAMAMQAFKSKTLNRTFDVIYFGTLAGHPANDAEAALPPGHPDIHGAKRGDAAKLAPPLPPGHPDIGSANTDCASTGSCSKLPAGHPAAGDWRDIVLNTPDDQ